MSSESKSVDKIKINSKFSRQMKLKLLWKYLFTNFIITLMLVQEFLKAVLKIFLPNRPKSIKDKLALITGGGNGIGREVAFKLAEKGCNIAIVDIDISAASRTVDEILAKHRVKAAFFKIDVSKCAEVQQLKLDIESKLGFVDILVNNAGLLALDVKLKESTTESIEKVIDVNLMSHFWTVRTFLDGMISRKYGHIIALGSYAGRMSIPGSIIYCASKFGVFGFMSALFDELCVAGHDEYIKTTTIYPLFVNTRPDLVHRVGDMPMWSARKIADELIKGVLVDRRNIFVPKIAKFSLLLNSMPDRIIRYVKLSNYIEQDVKSSKGNV